MPDQGELFGDDVAPRVPSAPLPAGFRYQPGLLAAADEARLVTDIRTLALAPFQFHGYTGNRRTVAFGWGYDFATERVVEAQPMPAFLEALREPVARFAGIEPAAFQQVLVTEYDAGAGIGWHRDKRVYGLIAGVSLLAPCTFRLRRAQGDGWQRVNLVAEPRSVYLLAGESRDVWEHSIPPVQALRYSVTFRTMRAASPAGR